MRGSRKGSPKYTSPVAPAGIFHGEKRELCLFWGHQPAEDGQLTKAASASGGWRISGPLPIPIFCMEQYMMAGKAELFGDQEIREQILKCSDPKQIKALGRKVRGL